MISYRLLIGISIAALLGVFFLVRSMHRLGLRAQFMVLLGLGVTIGFIFLVMVQMRSFPSGLAFRSWWLSSSSVCLARGYFCAASSQEDKKPKTKLARNIAAVPRVRDWPIRVPRDHTP